MKKVLFVASEGLPYIKSGGLADVIGSLPKALCKHDIDVRVVLPLYLKIAQQFHESLIFVTEYTVSIKYEEVLVRLWEAKHDGVMYYFIEHQGYFERSELYGYEDDGERFAYFQKAVLEMLNQLAYFPDILHCHDWHTGMLPAMCKENHWHDKRYRQIKHVYTIHNLAYQGNFGKAMLHSCLGLPSHVYDSGNVRFDDGISFMKSGIIYADHVTTVSPSYAKEILTPEYGEHLQQVLQMRGDDLSGIVNGIDVTLWDTKTDPAIAYPYHQVNAQKQKKLNKLALQKELGLEPSETIFLLGLVTRLTGQKGLDLVQEQMDGIIAAPMQVVILGSGDGYLEADFEAVAKGNRHKFAFCCGYDEALAHKIYASCDGFLMPSKFEPCGISQLISLHYGTLPFVRETGGLKDTVIPYNKFTGTGNGFTFAPFAGHEMLDCIHRGLHVYYKESKVYRQLVRNAMKSDVSWDKSAMEYIELYEQLLY